MSELSEFMVHPVTVKPKAGSGGKGTIWGTPVDFTVFADDKRRLVRATDGSQVVSETTIYDDDLSHEASYTLGSEVTLPSGRKATVISVARRELAALDLPSHLEVSLT